MVDKSFSVTTPDVRNFAAKWWGKNPNRKITENPQSCMTLWLGQNYGPVFRRFKLNTCITEQTAINTAVPILQSSNVKHYYQQTHKSCCLYEVSLCKVVNLRQKQSELRAKKRYRFARKLRTIDVGIVTYWAHHDIAPIYIIKIGM